MDAYGGRGPLILSTTWVLATVALIIMALRTYTNACIVKSFRWDFFWAALALVRLLAPQILQVVEFKQIAGMVTQAMLTVSVTFGIGNNISRLEPSEAAKSLEWVWIAQCLLIQSIEFGKYAVIAFILRIAAGVQSRKIALLTHFLYTIAGLNFAFNIVEMSMILNSCSPTAKLWDSNMPGYCNHLSLANRMGYFQGCKDDILSPVSMLISGLSIGC